ncbi:hypothetical protein An11g05090 [Aspergillus niger]|uniref:Uncharacterized protein n=2 Tax=Aspergillus niger TaxID=5061 RepID=A2QWG7_ASPNC|nr:hypothetical protein An11g05090 [Aspergillus niger]CAK48408.1 hypothetical protein An11g05090 [Aspergillus niger]
MALDSPYQFMARGHIATSLQTLYKTRSSNIVAARDLYRIYVASSFESSRANQSPRRVIISITIMLIQVLMIPPELLTGHLLNSNATENVVRMTMVFSSCFALSAISVVYSSIDHNQLLGHPDRVILHSIHALSRLFRGGYGVRCRGASVPLSRYGALSDAALGDCLLDAKFSNPNGYVRDLASFLVSCRAVQRYTVPVAFVVLYFFMRETAKIPLEDMGRVFEARNRDLVLYQVVLEPFEESRYGNRTGAIALD